MSEAGLLLVRQEMDKASEELSSNYLHPFFLQQYYLKAYLDVMNLHAGHESYDRSPFLLVYENQSDGNPHSVIAFVWDSIRHSLFVHVHIWFLKQHDCLWRQKRNYPHFG